MNQLIYVYLAYGFAAAVFIVLGSSLYYQMKQSEKKLDQLDRSNQIEEAGIMPSGAQNSNFSLVRSK